MSQIIMPRRRFLAGRVGLVAAPMVVKASSLMPVKLFDLKSPSDIVASSIYVDDWPVPGRSTWTVLAHRRDLADLGEPYLSAVLDRRVWDDDSRPFVLKRDL